MDRTLARCALLPLFACPSLREKSCADGHDWLGARSCRCALNQTLFMHCRVSWFEGKVSLLWWFNQGTQGQMARRIDWALLGAPQRVARVSSKQTY
jgi:hypothetical protein